jgi:hypothetical protein
LESLQRGTTIEEVSKKYGVVIPANLASMISVKIIATL